MNITDATYYQKGIKFIPNAEVSGTPVAGNPTNTTVSELDDFIVSNERLLLFSFLNVTLYDELQTALLDIDNAPTKWQNLIKGNDYIKDSVTYRFDGLRGFNKESLIAYFVYCEYIKNDNSYYATSGVVKTKSKNSEVFDATAKYITCYSAFLERYQDKEDCGEATYYISGDGVVGVDYFGNSDSNGVVTLETFLRDNKTDYEGYCFKRFERINSFGI